jgi:VIT1/CCC1 family predicted Fe2+/Mn2+ transporter
MVERLEHSHEPAEIAARIAAGPRLSYLPDAVFGAIDGTVTTFAVVAGAVGADLSARIVLILGAANLFGDGFSMAAGNFIGTRAATELADNLRAMEHRHIAANPDGEVAEVREIYRAKGFAGAALETITRLITSRRHTWVEVMLAEEHGLSGARRSPWRAASATFAAFVAAGAIPLLPFIAAAPNAPVVATAATGVVFVAIGSLKSFWSPRSWQRCALETFIIGMGAALIAYGIGRLAEKLL